MTVHLYFSLIPEALIASNLPPEEFGQYYATGSGFKSKGQCLFFEVDPTFRHPYFEIDTAFARCVPAPDGTPKHSVYVSTYRVLEHLPLSALGKLYLTTAYGHTLGLERGDALPARDSSGRHLYQDLSPVNSLVVSNLEPHGFYESVTVKPTKFVRFPALVFVELRLDDLATDPDELLNRYTHPEFDEVRRRLMRRLYERLRDRGDKFYHWMSSMFDVGGVDHDASLSGLDESTYHPQEKADA